MAQVLAKKAGHLCPGQRALHSPPASAVLDETCCCRIMCQHPLCWEAHLRCARGVPRYTAARAEPPEPQEDGLPTLKIQNIPGWSDDDLDGTDPGPFPRTFNSSEPSHLTAAHTKECSVIESSEVLHFPGRNSPRATRTLLMSERGFSPDPFYEKLRQSESSPRDSNRTDSIVIWVPNPQRSSQRIKPPGQTNSKPALLLSGKSERICISELIYSLPPSQTDKAHKMKRKKPFKLSHSVSLSTGGRKMAKQSIQAGHTERDSDVAQAEAVEPQPAQNKAARPKQQHGEQLLLHNRGVVLHSARGKKQSLEAGSGQGPGGFQYRLDDKSTDSPGKDKVDWESLGRQPLLWRRYLMSASRGKSKTAGPKSSRQLSQPLDPWVNFGIYSSSRDTMENIHPGQLPILEIASEIRYSKREVAFSKLPFSPYRRVFQSAPPPRSPTGASGFTFLQIQKTSTPPSCEETCVPVFQGRTSENKTLFCSYTAKADGRPCEFNGRVYQHGEDFQLNCKHQCNCMDGVVGCMPLCPQEVPLPVWDCPNPRLVKVPGHCCEEWFCDNSNHIREDSGDSQGSPELEPEPLTSNELLAAPQGNTAYPDWNSPPQSRMPVISRCLVQTTDWSDCSRTCGMGISSRVTNTNPACRLTRETRLCQIRACELPLTPSLKKGKKCQKTVRPREAVQISFAGCATSRRYRPRSCGSCSDGRCCSPSLTRTASLRFHCPDGESFTRSVMVIQRCHCRPRRRELHAQRHGDPALSLPTRLRPPQPGRLPAFLQPPQRHPHLHPVRQGGSASEAFLRF
ncbi:UNVERIFIED_CONTAM: hypothetical protein FKN15_013787 [Acipenser sinensis]